MLGALIIMGGLGTDMRPDTSCCWTETKDLFTVAGPLGGDWSAAVDWSAPC